MSLDSSGLVRLIEMLDFLLRQGLALNTNGLIDPLLAAETNDGTCHLRANPGKCNLRHRPALFFCELLDTVDDFYLRLGEITLFFGAGGRLVG